MENIMTMSQENMDEWLLETMDEWISDDEWLFDYNEGRTLTCHRCKSKRVSFYKTLIKYEGGKYFEIKYLFCTCGVFMGSDKTEIKRFEKWETDK